MVNGLSQVLNVTWNLTCILWNFFMRFIGWRGRGVVHSLKNWGDVLPLKIWGASIKEEQLPSSFSILICLKLITFINEGWKATQNNTFSEPPSSHFHNWAIFKSSFLQYSSIEKLILCFLSFVSKSCHVRAYKKIQTECVVH